jgi:hypothetical protein
MAQQQQNTMLQNAVQARQNMQPPHLQQQQQSSQQQQSAQNTSLTHSQPPQPSQQQQFNRDSQSGQPGRPSTEQHANQAGPSNQPAGKPPFPVSLESFFKLFQAYYQGNHQKLPLPKVQNQDMTIQHLHELCNLIILVGGHAKVKPFALSYLLCI